MWKFEDRLRLMPTHNRSETCSRMDKVSEKVFCFYFLKNMSGPKKEEGRKYWTRTFIIFFLSAATMVIKQSNI